MQSAAPLSFMELSSEFQISLFNCSIYLELLWFSHGFVFSHISQLFSLKQNSHCTLDVQYISADTVSNLLVNIMEHLAGRKTDISLWSWTPQPVNYYYRQFMTLSIDPGPVWMFLLQRKLFSIAQIKSRQGLDALCDEESTFLLKLCIELPWREKVLLVSACSCMC